MLMLRKKTREMKQLVVMKMPMFMIYIAQILNVKKIIMICTMTIY